MAKNNDDVVIKRARAKKTEEKPEPPKNESGFDFLANDGNRKLYANIFSAMLALFAFLLFLALISYTPKDELNAKITISELFSLFSSDSMIRIKADTTYNWLGLLGAVIANVMINWTIGYFIVFLPIFLFLWAMNIFKSGEISEKLIKNTSIYLILSLLLASFIGTIRIFSESDIAKEWSGAVGIFLSTIVSKLIGTFGAFILFLALIVLVLVFGTNIKWRPLLDFVIKYAIIIKDFAIKAFNFLFVKVKDFEEANREMLSTKDTTEDISDDGEKEAKNEEIDINTKDEKPQISIVETKDPVIKISPTEPARIVRSSFHPDVKSSSSPAPKIIINKESILKSEKPLNITIDKPIQEIGFNDEPIGLQNFVSDEKIAIGTRSSMLEVKEKEVLLAESNMSEEKIEQETESNEPIGSVLSNAEPNDLESVPENVAEEESISTEYFKIDEKEEEIEIDPALMIKSAPPRVELPPNKPILPPEPIRVSPPVQQPTRSPLVVHVEEAEPEAVPSLNTPLGVGIHDEEIDYKPPTIDLLDKSSAEMKVSDEELKSNARILQEKLETFKIFIENLTVTPGPVVTQYEFVPAAGIKISRIESLADDLAMALKAKGIRIIAPIPGKGTVGIEIPNLHPSMVRFSHVVNTSKFYESNAKLPLALGKTISGEVLVADLAKAPHLLIAGSTGSGKSVGINTIINSLLYRMKPSDLKFVVVDPKKVELPQYSRLRHHFMALSPDIEDTIITNPADAVSVLKSVVLEMENRYDILARVGQRNISDYNDKVRAGTYQSIKDFDHRPMPYIVVIIDEFADLMLTASKDVEEPIIRLAQMARAIGIHLIVATQRPSVDVITGIIKANFPARIAYLVASKIDSRTILDISGAEKLLGNGDMLFLPGGSPKPLRIQNAFISTDEVENICNFIGKQDGYSQPYLLPSILEDNASGGNISADERDPLFSDAARLVVQHQQASVSLVQRRLKVGYARAGRIIDELEDAGIVGPNEGSKARIVLYESEADLERIL